MLVRAFQRLAVINSAPGIRTAGSYSKSGKVLNKIMYGSERAAKRKWYGEKNRGTGLSGSTVSLSVSGASGGGKSSSRRMAVLNKLFMEQITDLMATGEHSEELVGYGIQISRVKMSSDFHGLNVFWFSRDSGRDMDIGRLLKRVSNGLRHELSQLRLMGQVPRLNFVKDKGYGLITDLDGALKKADFGEDFVPTDATLNLKAEYKLDLTLPDSVRKEIGQLDRTSVDTPLVDDDDDPLPVMRHDVLGLDHAAIMNKINKYLNRNKQAWAQYNKEARESARQKGSKEAGTDAEQAINGGIKQIPYDSEG
ncbi:uncharacterized protein LOC129740151 [Uranotaenia lowii]|uniref:uncharacterized protein LOC129740151 n=1 Tax=Uranotaenia lowii TaxID=190385 RepID=UPI00247AF81A|nr:uncharacterized protein LOC129740151 [Uranotaenia lowii]